MIRMISLLIGFVVSTGGVFASHETPVERKTLYLHVGPHKTGTTSIQFAALENRDLLRQHGLYYPPDFPYTRWRENHHEMVFNLRKAGYLPEILDRLKQIETEAGDCQSILLSSEELSVTDTTDPQYLIFLDYLLKNFNLKIIYCIRESSDRIASLATHLACWEPGTLIPQGNIQTFVEGRLRHDQQRIAYYAGLGCRFLNFGELVTSGNLVAAFFKLGLGLDVDIPNKLANEKDSHSPGAQKLSVEDLEKLEIFYNVPKDALAHANREPISFIRLIHSLSKKVAVQSLEMDPCIQDVDVSENSLLQKLPKGFEARQYICLNEDLVWQTRFMSKLARIRFVQEHYAEHGRNEGRLFVSLPTGFDPLQYLSLHEDLTLVTQDMSFADKIEFAQEHYSKHGHHEKIW